LRCGPLATVMQESRGARRIRVRLASPGFALAEWLAAQPGVSDVKPSDHTAGAEFTLAGDDARTSELLRALVAAGAPVCGFQEAGETFEQLYSRLSSGETM